MKSNSKCNKTAHICDKNQYKEAGFFDNIKMTIHLFMCKYCREYSKRNVKLTKTIASANIKTLPPEQKELLKHRLTQEMNNHSNS